MAKKRPSASKAKAAGESKEVTLNREYSTASDHVTVYSDQINVVSTGTELIISVYQTIPGYPDEKPKALSARRATVIVSAVHARELGALLTQHAEAVLDRSAKESSE